MRRSMSEARTGYSRSDWRQNSMPARAAVLADPCDSGGPNAERTSPRPGAHKCSPANVSPSESQAENAGRSRSEDSGSLDLEVLRGCLAAVLDEFVLNGLSFVQRAKTCAFDRRNMDEHILPAFLRLDEAVALRRIEPLYGALRHCQSPKYCQQLECGTLRNRRKGFLQAGKYLSARFFSRRLDQWARFRPDCVRNLGAG